MRKNIQYVSLILIFAALCAFSMPSESIVIGTYGVSKSDPSSVELQLNDDGSFHYQDFSNASKRIDVTGSWVLRKGMVILKDHNYSKSFHDRWRISEDGKVARSRNGLSFYRLIRI